LVVGLAVDGAGNLYAAVDSFDPATHGIWRVSRTGASERIAALDPTGFPNGLAFDNQGDLFVTDSSLGTIWPIDRRGGAATAWLKSPLLAGDPVNGVGTGANGIAYRHGSLYISNTDAMSIVRVPISIDGSAGVPAVYVAGPAIGFADGIAFDVRGNLYVASSFSSNTLVRISPDLRIESLATAADGLDYTASLAFGQVKGANIRVRVMRRFCSTRGWGHRAGRGARSLPMLVAGPRFLVRWPERKRAVRPLAVVMVGIEAKDVLEVPPYPRVQ
jgi:sugar lactone lactonase YvrE